MKPPHILIIGAGIVGASLAYHLGRYQVRVTVLDKAVDLATNVTATSFAWLTAGYGQAAALVNLRHSALAEWHRLQQELPGRLPIEWNGALRWFADPTATARFTQDLVQGGYPIRLLAAAQIRALEPYLARLPPHALFAPQEGALDALRVTELLLQAARAAGATIQLGNEVQALLTKGSGVTGVVTANGNLAADVVVLAAGAATASLGHSLGLHLPLAESPAILLRFHSSRRFVQRIVSMPELELRAASATQLLAAEEYGGEVGATSPPEIATRTLASIQAQWRGTEHLRLAQVQVSRRPMPTDELPLIGHVPGVAGVYILSMHAGVTLAALAGRLAAREIATHQDEALATPYRLARFR